MVFSLSHDIILQCIYVTMTKYHVNPPLLVMSESKLTWSQNNDVSESIFSAYLNGQIKFAFPTVMKDLFAAGAKNY